MITRHRQRGMTMIGWLILLAMLGFFVLLGLRLMPAYMEYYSVVNAVRGVAENSTTDTSFGDMRTSIQRRFIVNSVTSLRASEVKIERENGAVFLHVDYEVRTPIMGNVDAVVAFDRKFEVGQR